MKTQISARKRIWIVVADSASARFFGIGRTHRGLATAKVLKAAKHAHTAMSDRPGRIPSSGRGGLRHALEARHDYKKMAKQRFSSTVAEQLDEAHQAGAFDTLVLVAPRRMLGELRMLLPSGVAHCVQKEIAKDLTKETPTKLWAHLLPHLFPIVSAIG